MHELPLLTNIIVALAAAFFGGMIARRIGLPGIVGYMLAGVAIGPFTPGFVGDTETIRQLAELGVIFLMFGVGLHFSLSDLWKVRGIAIPGALGQMALATLLGFALSQILGWPAISGIVLGLAISIASTVVLLRGLMDNGLLNTPPGQAAVGWLVLEDLATILILVLMPVLSHTTGGMDWLDLGLTLLKVSIFILLLQFAGTRLIPWLLERIAYTRSRELFILAILTVALGTALGAAKLFGVSLALGAFAAGVVVSRSPLSYQVGADVLPFRDAFAVLFFVSIGMLVNPGYIFDNIGSVLALTGLILVGKPVITMLMGLCFPWPARTVLVVAAGLSQIGEFSFILGQAGVSLGLLSHNHYSLILAGAILSITLNPAMFRLIGPAEKLLHRFPGIWKTLDRHGPKPEILPEEISGHIVIVGFGRVGRYVVNILEQMALPHLVVEVDQEKIKELERCHILTLYGDAANSEILEHAGLRRARALVITMPDETASELAVATARRIAPDLSIIVRAANREGVTRLSQLGAQHVIYPEMEGGLEIVRQTFIHLGFPLQAAYRYADAVRRDYYNMQDTAEGEHRLLLELMNAAENIEIVWLRLPPGNPLAGRTLAETNIRARTGASVVAIMRNRQLMANPESTTLLLPEDHIGLIGEREQVEAAKSLLSAAE